MITLSGMFFFRSITFSLLVSAVCLRAAPVVMEFFHTPGCIECEEVKRDIVLPLTDEYGELLELRTLDLTDAQQFPRLTHYRTHLARTNQAVSAATVVLNGALLFEIPDLRSPDFEQTVAVFVAENWDTPPTLAPSVSEEGLQAVSEKYRAFTVAGIAVAGLVDGMNPCAISALVFLASVLAVSRRRKRDMVLMGASFCIAAFLTYFLIGLGAFGVLRRLTMLGAVRNAIRLVLTAVLLIFAALSAMDAIRFRRKGRPEAILLKLPARLQRVSHKIMRDGFKTRSIFLGGFLTGAATTLVESVCTGQVYVPVLVTLTRLQGNVRALLLLGLYNLMFILPLVLVLAAFFAGVRIPALVNWSAKHAVLAKWTMALFFLLLACLTAIMDQ